MKIENINKVLIDDFVKLKSISFIEGVVPPLENLKIIIKFVNKKNICKISDLKSLINIENNELLRAIIWLAKYGYLKIKSDNE